MKNLKRVFIVMVIIASFGFLVSCTRKDESIINNNEKIKELKLPNSDDCCINLNMYFDGSKSKDEVKVLKENRIIKKEDLVGEVIMQELIKGPSVESQLKPIFPKDTKLLSFCIKDKIAYVNLSSDAKHQMTYAKEKVCLESILLSLTQLESVEKLKILIDNKNVEYLGGNFDVSKPFGINDIENIKK